MSSKKLGWLAVVALASAAVWTGARAQSARTTSAARNELTITFADGTKQTVALRQSADKIVRIEFGKSSTGSAGVTVPEPTVTSPLMRYAGVWEEVGNKEGFDQITFTVSGSRLSGEYEHDAGRISATLAADGKSVTGQWSEEPSRAEPNDAGKVKLALSADGKTMTLHFSWGDSDNWTETVLKKVK